MSIQSENKFLTMNLSEHITKEFILELIDKSMPSYIKNLLKKEEINYRFSTKEDFDDVEDEQERSILENETFALFVTDFEDDGDEFSYVNYEILLNYDPMVNLEIEEGMFESFFEGNMEYLVSYTIITNILTSFYHELGHAVDFFILDDQEIIVHGLNEYSLGSFAFLDEEFYNLLESEKDFTYDYLNMRDYLNEEKDEYFAEYYGLYMTYLIFSETKDMSEFYLNENLYNYFEKINNKVISIYSD